MLLELSATLDEATTALKQVVSDVTSKLYSRSSVKGMIDVYSGYYKGQIEEVDQELLALIQEEEENPGIIKIDIKKAEEMERDCRLFHRFGELIENSLNSVRAPYHISDLLNLQVQEMDGTLTDNDSAMYDIACETYFDQLVLSVFK